MDSIKKIVFIGDLLRIQERGKKSKDGTGFADQTLAWEYQLFKYQIEQATKLPTEVVFCSDTERFDLREFYRLCGAELCMQSWIHILHGKYSSEALAYFKSCFNNCLVITQVGGSMIPLLEEADIPYIDIYVSAIKFASDIHLAFRSNVESIRQQLLHFQLAESYLMIEAQKMKAYNCARAPHSNLADNSLLLIGQIDIDLSLLKDEKLVSFLDYKEELIALTQQFDTVYYKRHPYAKPSSASEKLILSLPHVALTEEPFYKLMSYESITTVAALSSGTLEEARYFGKKPIYLSHQFIKYYRGEGVIDKETFVICENKYFSPRFWQTILSDVVPTYPCDDYTQSYEDNFLRSSINTWWGYEINKSPAISSADQLITSLKKQRKKKRRAAMRKMRDKILTLLSSFIPWMKNKAK